MANPQESNHSTSDAELLLNDGGSDDESSYTESPADGYFAERSHPRDAMFVQNPTMTQENKAREAMVNSATGSHSQISSPAASLRTRSYSAESLPVPVLDAGPAPPDYAAATAHPTGAPSSPYQDHAWHSERPSMDSRTSYGGVDGVQARPDPTGRLQDQSWPLGAANNPFGPGFPFHNTNNSFGSGFPFANNNSPFVPGFPFNHPNPALSNENRPDSFDHEPQQMSDRTQTPEALHEQTGLLRWNRSVQPKRKSWLSRSPCKPKSLITILIAVAIALLIVFTARSRSDPGEARSGDGPDNNRNYTSPTIPGGSDSGDNDHKPPQSTAFPTPTQRPSPSCPISHRTDTVAFAFEDPGSFFFVEAIETRSEFYGKIKGDVRIRRAQQEQETDIILYIAVGTTSPWEVAGLDYDQTESSFLLNMPKLHQNDGTQSNKPCIEINVWIDVRKGVRLDDLGLDAAHLNIIIEKGLSEPDSDEPDDAHLYVKNLANFSTLSGNVKSAYWKSRDTIVRTISGDIQGDYALLDSLGIYSTSGNVNINVDPCDADEENPKPADFEAETTSGTIRINFPSINIPERLYNTRVETTSADISGHFILGQKTIFQSTSGNMVVELLPYSPEGTGSALQTSAQSSNTVVTILSPYNGGHTPWRQLHHSGSCSSGNVRLTYPPEWEGHIDLFTLTGDIRVRGNVRTVHEDNSPSGHRYSGVKGSGDGALSYKTLAGNVYVQVGS